MNGKQPTIKDIAREASVSGTTVSRYLNGKYEFMSEDTRNKIEKIIKELDYRPSNIARSLKSNKSKVIGAVIADIENHFSAQIIKGLTDKANDLGYSLMISISNNSLEKEKEGIERFLDNRVDGLIINTVAENEVYLKEIHDRVPTVFIDRGVNTFKVNTITSNNYELGLKMMNHLAESSFQSIGYFTEAVGTNTVRKERHQVFLDGPTRDEDVTKDTYIVDVRKENTIKEQLDKHHQTPRPRVIFCSNGVVMQSVLKVMKEYDYRLKTDFSICGYDNWVWASLVGESGITVIEQDSYTMGTESISLIYKKLNQELLVDQPQNIFIEGRLIVRGSTKNIEK